MRLLNRLLSVDAILGCCTNCGSQDACKFASFLQKCVVLSDSSIPEILQPVDALIDFFERQVKLRSELSV
jgi:hypothetical protein